MAPADRRKMGPPRAEQTGLSGRARGSRWRFYRALVLLALVVLFALVGPFSLSRYDAAHPVNIECSVSSAEDRTGSSVARTGLGRSFTEVKVQTSDCGKILLREGESEVSATEVARRLNVGGKYEFVVGGGSYQLRSLLSAIGRDVTATEYKKTG